jgi:outer membrane protein OmpA-like peptidoglycan-associated protein
MKRSPVLALLVVAGSAFSAEAQPTAVLPPSAEAAAIGGALSQSFSQAQRLSVSPETVRPPSAAFLIEFEFDSARLTTEGAVFLGRIVEIILSSPELSNARFLLDGHTDAVGSRGYNQSLGQARAARAAGNSVLETIQPELRRGLALARPRSL